MALLPSPVHAASKWYHAGTTNIGKWKLFIDLDSIESPEQGVYEFWSKVVDTGSTQRFPGTANEPIRCRIDLRNRTMGEYTGNNITMQKIVPDSMGDAYRDIFLQWVKDKVNLPVPHQ